MKRVIGIDPSLSCTALAFAQRGQALTIRTKAADYASAPERLDDMRAQLLANVRYIFGVWDGDAELVVIEGYSFGSNLRGQHAITEWGGLLRWTLWREGIPYIEIPPTSLKKFVCGKGNADKEIMIREVFRKWGFEARDNNEADAYGLMQIGKALLSANPTQYVLDLMKKCPLVGGEWEGVSAPINERIAK